MRRKGEFENLMSCDPCRKEKIMRTQAAFQKCAETIMSQVREQWAGKQARLDELIGAERSRGNATRFAGPLRAGSESLRGASDPAVAVGDADGGSTG